MSINMGGVHSERKVKRIIWETCGDTLSGNVTNGNRNGNGNGNGNSFPKLRRDEFNKRPRYDPTQVTASTRTCHSEGPYVMPLVSIPSVQEYNLNSKASIVLSGTARKGGLGPSVGAFDIGIGKSAYYFRVALPGVKKDPGEFSCEIDHDGKVHVRGELSTGGKTVARNSRVFEMKFQQHSPPGPFTLSFSLPGPVDPRLFYPIFRSDGILEAVVMKYE